MADPEDFLSGQIVLITGASRGLGRSLALHAARAGATVVACGRDVAALERLAQAIDGHGPVPVLCPINLEAAGVDDYAMVAGLIAEQFGRLDALVLNAAHPGDLSPLPHYDPATWARVFQVNVHSPFLMLRALYGVLDEAPRPLIAFTLAAEARPGLAHWGAYAAAKAALATLMETCAAERPEPGAVFGVVPPPMNTRLRLTAYPSANRDELARPDDVAARYVALLNPASGPASGTVVALGGGKT